MSSDLVVLSHDILSKYISGDITKIKEDELLFNMNKAFGKGGLGILTISDVPGYSVLRKKVLVLAQRVALLSDDQKAIVSHPESNYTVGWSHGVEKLDDGEPDTMKGSFYANPNFNDPIRVLRERGVQVSAAEVNRNSFYTTPNIWPSEIPELENLMLELGTLITETGILLAKVCDSFILKNNPNHTQLLHRMIEESVCHKARLLHYFPPSKVDDTEDVDPEKWCGIHCDHSILTGLCRAMYLTPQEEETVSQDPNAGLYIVDRNNRRVKIDIPENHVGFQLGQVTQLISNNFLQATPHLVRAPSSPTNSNLQNISRNTLAVFLQPFWAQKIETTVEAKDLMPGFESDLFFSGMDFGQFTEAVLTHYAQGGYKKSSARL